RGLAGDEGGDAAGAGVVAGGAVCGLPTEVCVNEPPACPGAGMFLPSIVPEPPCHGAGPFAGPLTARPSCVGTPPKTAMSNPSAHTIRPKRPSPLRLSRQSRDHSRGSRG